jgi:hypothetical protein
MKSRYLLLVALGALACGDSSLRAQKGGPKGFGDPQAAKYGWLSTLEEGKAQARQNGKPLMVVLRCVP